MNANNSNLSSQGWIALCQYVMKRFTGNWSNIKILTRFRFDSLKYIECIKMCQYVKASQKMPKILLNWQCLSVNTNCVKKGIFQCVKKNICQCVKNNIKKNVLMC